MIPPKPIVEPFNLAEAKAGRELVTDYGDKARFIAHVPEAGEPHRVIVLIEGDSSPTCLHENGKVHANGSSDRDLFLVAEEHVLLWVNLYPEGEGSWFKTEELAKAHRHRGCMAVCPIWVPVSRMPLALEAELVKEQNPQEPTQVKAGDLTVLPPNHKPAPPKSRQPGRLVQMLVGLDVKGGEK
ncbi:hypothetical protein [Verrucomicrobium sp. BvORR106]|uniref:hypothetical protein n=1 Tax=Verrucomicrobium sp. BvORR106 TaxID=1403819 RepID=UPI000570DF96|nr:hypothetical protein [Verrucomicrobium sp. BvORR106]